MAHVENNGENGVSTSYAPNFKKCWIGIMLLACPSVRPCVMLFVHSLTFVPLKLVLISREKIANLFCFLARVIFYVGVKPL